VAAPMTASANNDTTIAGTRLEAASSAGQAVDCLGLLDPVFQPPAFLACQASRELFPRRDWQNEKSRRVDDSATSLAR
jgi:hypothetical protein